jgi:hypothetical protein
MYAYSSGGDDSKYPVTLKISDSQLFVSAQGEDQPVLLKVSWLPSQTCPHSPPTVCDQSQ